MRTRHLLSAVAAILLAVPATATAQTMDEHKVVTPDTVEWAPGPASIPPGAEAAVLYGDPSKEGLFALRLKLPQGYHIAPHSHPKPEVVTVISGTFRLGMGESADEGKAEPLSAGSFFAMARAWRTMPTPTRRRLSKSTAPAHGRSPTSIRRTTRARRRSNRGGSAEVILGGVAPTSTAAGGPRAAALLAAFGIAWNLRVHGEWGPTAIGAAGALALLYALLGAYDWRVEASGFVALAGAALWDRHLFRGAVDC